jgi:leucyl aminopeptidase
MELRVNSGNPEKQRTACLVLGVFEARKLPASAARIDEAADGAISTVMRRGDMSGKLGQVLMLYDVAGTLADRVLLVGCGRERDLDEIKFRTVVSKAGEALGATGAADAVNCLADLDVKGRDLYWKIRHCTEAASDALYRFERLKSKKSADRSRLKKLVLSVPARGDLPAGERAVRDGQAVSAGVELAKDLANLPGNVCTPSYLAEQAIELGRKYRSIATTVLDAGDMKELGMGALLAVAQGSREPAKLIVMEYQGKGGDEKPIVLVGKGVTFDSGGISIKPAAAMDEMKFDMSGAAAVIGTLRAVAELKLPLKLIGIVPATENLPDGHAIKPGDIVTSMSGQTIEILNTDAEGRLILCDALSYAERYHPRAVIDIATLTGACVVALGNHASGLFSNHEPLANDLLNASRTSCDRAWQMPLWEDYQTQLDSRFADFANVGGREGGSITAACFLSRFTRKYHWAHLDIAGTAWRTGKQKGATGRPVPLLTQYLLDQCRDQD